MVYSDGTTPNVTYTNDRLGRQITITCNGITTTFAYNTANQVLSESYSGGTLAGQAVTNGYDAFLRRTALGISTQTSALAVYGYDNASRLSSVANGINSVAYGYVANSPLVGQIEFANSGALRARTTKNYDNLNRLSSISTANAKVIVLDSHAYPYNNANQRTGMTNSDSSFSIYQYDSLGQVTNGIRHWSDGAPVAGEQFGYAFDSIGNRQSTTAGGDQNGANIRSATYSPNNLNQYSSRTVPNAVDIIDSATNGAAVTVNGQSTYRRNDFYRAQLTIDNSAGSVFQSVSNFALLNLGANAFVTNITGNVFLPQSPENFSYDNDGNLTSDGRWTYTWDAENRLSTAVARTSASPQQSMKFVRDNVAEAEELLCSCGAADRFHALQAFGSALHTVQDSTSPAHNGHHHGGPIEFKPWHGLGLNPIDYERGALRHVIRENFDPQGGRLDHATRDLWDKYFKCKTSAQPFPPDFFTYGVDTRHGGYDN